MIHTQDNARLVYSTNGSHTRPTRLTSPIRQSRETLLGHRMHVLSVDSIALFHWLWHHLQQSGKTANYLDDSRVATFSRVSVDGVPDARDELMQADLIGAVVTERTKNGLIVRGATYSLTSLAIDEAAVRTAMARSRN